jgi:hypothetical protein
MTLATGRLAAVVLRGRRNVLRVTRASDMRIRGLRGRARNVRLQSDRQLKSQKRKDEAGE